MKLITIEHNPIIFPVRRRFIYLFNWKFRIPFGKRYLDPSRNELI